MENIISNLKKIRERKGYSQEYMALQLAISQASYARIENQETKLTIERLQQIAIILEISVFVSFNSSSQEIESKEKKIGETSNNTSKKISHSKNESINVIIEIL